MFTLKRIADEKLNLSSKKGFSLNGGIRNTSYIGQTSLARTNNKNYFTRYQGPQGYGGCCGTYVLSYTKKSSCCSNNPKIIKKSVKNTNAMIRSKYKWINTKYPNIVVQPDSNYPLNDSSGSYTSQKAFNTIANGMKIIDDEPCVTSSETININDKSSQVTLNKYSSCYNIQTFPGKINNSSCGST